MSCLTEHNDYQTQLTGQENQISFLQAEISDHRNTIANQQITIIDLQTQIILLNSKVDFLWMQVQNINPGSSSLPNPWGINDIILP